MSAGLEGAPTTEDRPAPGLCVVQPRRGFRYGAEAFWLAGFALEGGAADAALDLGTGSGIVALLLASCGIASTGVDVRAEWAPLWARSLARSTTAAPCALERLPADRAPAGPWPLIVSNPPYFPRGTGPVSPDPWKRAARTEDTAGLADFTRAALTRLAPIGRACFVLPVDRAPELAGLAREHACRVTRRVDVGARRSLVELAAGDAPDGPTDQVDEGGVRVRGWYAAVGARFATPGSAE